MMEFQRVCPFCAEPLDPQDVFCEACGRHLASAAERGEEQQPAADDGDFELPAPNGCAQCGSLSLSQDGYCESCGAAQPRPRDHQERELSGVAAVSDRGVRHHRNEDAFAVAATSLPGGENAQVAVVCDGVSSASRPDEASQTAADTASEALLTALEHGVEPEPAMRGAILTAAEAVAELGRTSGPEAGRNSPACTFVGAVAAGGVVTIGWVGDSRAYWIPDDREGAEPYRLTEDDSWAAGMVAAGLMSEAEAYADARAHAITGWLGADAEEVEPHTVAFTPHVPGVLVICSDGLWNYAEAATDLADLVRVDAQRDPLRAARAMVSFAVGAGGHDNITVAVLPVLPDPAGGYTDTLLDLPVITAPAAAPPMPPVPPVPPHPPLPLPPR
ncbi:protein phosphatase 2C domain-containing protein [Kitasatospora sp. GAS206B]|uniref:protein phosphatase 2C domain-containing protein n=1 Tax=unclassified Kitasatospora TaxID=2633591 RepID=UPI00247BD1FF|nr:serine/threonine protein phosphatase PrpC [Kitasatospora sp. GAS204B]